MVAPVASVDHGDGGGSSNDSGSGNDHVVYALLPLCFARACPQPPPSGSAH
jgi:hypothetical protein